MATEDMTIKIEETEDGLYKASLYHQGKAIDFWVAKFIDINNEMVNQRWVEGLNEKTN